MQESIKNALEEWNFDMVYNLYTKKDLITYEYIDFLYQTGSVDRLFFIFKNASAPPNWWNDMHLGSFLEFYDFLSKIQTFSDDEIIDCIKKEKYTPMCINYIISRLILNFLLNKEIVITLLPYVIKNKSFIFQSSFIKRVVDYFSCIDKKFFCNESRNILTILQENFPTDMTTGARIYYEKFLLNYNFNTFPKLNIKSPKKIALCIGGAMRGREWELNLKKVIGSFGFDVDVFLFTWDQEFLWPGLNGGGGHWARRLLNKEILNSVPEEIMHKNNLKQYFPNVFSKFNQEYSVKLDVKKLQNIKIIKKVIVQNYEHFLKKYSLDKDNLFINVSKVWYSNYQLLKSVICYEVENDFSYDFIIKVRPDLEYDINFSVEKLEKLYLNDLMIKHHESLRGGLNDNFAAGRRGVMEVYLSLWKYGFLNKSIAFFKNFPNFNSAHDFLQQFCSLMKINCMCLESHTIKEFYFIDFIPPDFSKELNLDCERIKNNIDLKNKDLHKSIEFLLKYQEYSKTVDKLHQSQRRRGGGVGRSAFDIIKEGFVYKLGKALIKVSKNWYKNGLSRLWFKLNKKFKAKGK